MFESILGNDSVKMQLTHMVESGSVGQSLLFAGEGGEPFALELARSLLQTAKKNPPDLHLYHPEGKIGMHSMESMRAFIKEVYLAPLESGWKVFILHDAERMLPASANALLKTFEEPAPDTLIILLSAYPDKLLPTIRSRCRTLRLTPTATPTQEALLEILAASKWRTWKELSDSAAAISHEIEEEQSAIRENLLPKDQEFTAVQRQTIEKEIDGALSMHLMQRAHILFNTILSWYRDLELIHLGGDPRYLLNPNHRDALIDCCRRGERLDLSLALAAVSHAKTALDRSTPFTQTLETLFLKLQRL